MTNAPQLPTDAEKLLSVCRVVWPHHTFAEGGGVVCAQTWPSEDVEEGFCVAVDSLDNLARILRELTPGQRVKFRLMRGPFYEYEADGQHIPLLSGYYLPMDAYEALTAPLPVLLDALYRAVCAK